MVTCPKDIYSRFDSKEHEELAKIIQDYSFIGMQLASTQLIIPKNFHHKPLEREVIPQLVHTY